MCDKEEHSTSELGFEDTIKSPRETMHPKGLGAMIVVKGRDELQCVCESLVVQASWENVSWWFGKQIDKFNIIPEKGKLIYTMILCSRD